MRKQRSLSDIYKANTALRKSTILWGQEVVVDEGLEWRVKWGQRGIGVSAFLVVACWVARQNVLAGALFTISLFFLGMLYYKNVSFVIARRLLREMNVVVIIVLGLCIFTIDTVQPKRFIDPFLGFMYMLSVCAFVFLDAVKVKSRAFVIAIGFIFISLNTHNIYNLIFGDWGYGVVLFKYSIQGNEYNFMKRSSKRYIFIQVMLFGVKAIYAICKDQKMELMIFATGHIYRETGTASKEVEDKTHSMKMSLENAI